MRVFLCLQLIELGPKLLNMNIERGEGIIIIRKHWINIVLFKKTACVCEEEEEERDIEKSCV